MYRIICIGKIKEEYLTKGILEYKKRINGFSSLEIIELKEYNTLDISKNVENEGKEILSRIKNDDYVISLEIEGNVINSVEFSQYLEKLSTYGKSRIIFVIGGSNGLSNEVKKRSDYALSFSKMTFPHQLMRLIIMEQIYRALTIMNNREYHK
jgi:rRNA large subunit m3Psi methyltransferase rlmH